MTTGDQKKFAIENLKISFDIAMNTFKEDLDFKNVKYLAEVDIRRRIQLDIYFNIVKKTIEEIERAY